MKSNKTKEDINKRAIEACWKLVDAYEAGESSGCVAWEDLDAAHAAAKAVVDAHLAIKGTS